MSGSQVTVGPLTDAGVPALIDLTIAQETRWFAGDPRLGRARGYAQPILFNPLSS